MRGQMQCPSGIDYYHGIVETTIHSSIYILTVSMEQLPTRLQWLKLQKKLVLHGPEESTSNKVPPWWHQAPIQRLSDNPTYSFEICQCIREIQSTFLLNDKTLDQVSIPISDI